MRGDGQSVFMARDVYPTWRRYVRAAQSEVVIFSPYLDRLAVSLLEQCPLPNDRVHVITDLSQISGNLSYRGQLLALKRLLTHAIEVRSLARLHAKVLLVDGRPVTVGSQNFTSYARSSLEATVDPRVDLDGTDFLRQLRSWQADAQPVSVELIERLLARIEGPLEAFMDAHQSLVEATEVELAVERSRQWRAALQRERESALTTTVEQRLRQSVRNARLRNPHHTAYGRVRSVWSEGRNSWYRTLEADRDMDFTMWMDTSSGNLTMSNLIPFNFYPIVVRPSGRIAVGRVTRTRITFLWMGLIGQRWISNRRICLNADFPAAPDDGANIVLSLRPSEESQHGCRLRFLYDGADVAYISDEAFGPAGPIRDRFYDWCLKALDTSRDSLLDFVFENYDPAQVGLRTRNAEKFFTDPAYRLDLVKFGIHHVLIATPV